MSASSEKKRRQEERLAKAEKKAAVQREAEEQAKKSQLKWRLAMVGIAVFVVLSIVLNTALPFRMTAVKVGGENYSAAEMNYFYANAYYQYYDYLSLFGVDLSQPLQNQDCALTEEGSWFDYLMDQAKANVEGVEAMCQAAAAAGYELSEEGKASLEDEMSHLPEYAKANNFNNVNKYLKAVYGTGMNETLLLELMTKATLATEYANSVAEGFEFSDAELQAYYDKNVDNYRVYDVHYYYIAAGTKEVTDAEGKTTTEVVEGGIDAALEIADGIAAKVTNEASFDAAVAAYAADATVSHTHGAIKSSLNAAFRDWATDAARAEGDVTTVTNDTGAYVVLYLGYSDHTYPSTAMRHILIKTVDENGDGNYSEDEMNAAKAKVEAIEAEWLASDMTEETFAALANQYSEDAGSNTIGGLYEGIGQGNMVSNIDEFLFTAGRQVGDTAILHGNNGSYDGYHLVYFVGEGQLYGLVQAEADLLEETYTAWETEALEGFTAETGAGYKLIGK